MTRTNKHKAQEQIMAEPSSNGADLPEVKKPAKQSSSSLVEEHLPPLSLVCCVLICSGSLFVLGLRDVLATGKIVAGPPDEALLQFTDSTSFYDDALGWKSTQGGLSAVMSVTTDANNMGGLFVRKMGGAAAAIVHLQKLLPLLFHPEGAQWMAGHFHPLYWMAIVGNMAIAAFYACYMEDLVASKADELPKFIMGILGLECLVLFYNLLTGRRNRKRMPAVAMPEGKTPESLTSRIVTRTVVCVSSMTVLIMLRDLLAPGFIFEYVPRDDIYLEWTGSFLHSPPDGSVESDEQGMEVALFVGDKFVSQFMALHMLILCAYKFLTAFGIKYGSDGGGQAKCKMIWKAQCIGNMSILFLLRLFSGAALSASLDLRWHLMMVGYEGFILGLYTWF